jgi:hypothetical protein
MDGFGLDFNSESSQYNTGHIQEEHFKPDGFACAEADSLQII